MSLFANGIITLYNYFTSSANSFIVLAGTSPRKFVSVQPEAGDTIESLAQKIRDRVKDEGGTWIKRWMPPKNPSELEKAFDEAVEWTVAYAEFEKARASMLRSPLSKKYGKEHSQKLIAFIVQAIHGDAKDKGKPWFGMNESLWQSHKNLSGMAREKAMQQTVEEKARQKKMFANETLVNADK